jgi:hypothetical protein
VSDVDDTSRRSVDGRRFGEQREQSRSWTASIAITLIGLVLLAGMAAVVAAPGVPFGGQDAVHRMTANAGAGYAHDVAAGCPDIAERAREMLADGEVTREEIGVLDTLVERIRAVPGGISSCPVEPLHLDRGTGWTIVTY